jgi:hypothetical protein
MTWWSARSRTRGLPKVSTAVEEPSSVEMPLAGGALQCIGALLQNTKTRAENANQRKLDAVADALAHTMRNRRWDWRNAHEIHSAT